MKLIKITVDDIDVQGELNNSSTTDAFGGILPIDGRVNLWGDEIYFSTAVQHEPEPTATEVVSSGDLGYWPPGSAFCIFFGLTPASTGEEIRAASPINVIGQIIGNEAVFKSVKNGSLLTIAKQEG